MAWSVVNAVAARSLFRQADPISGEPVLQVRTVLRSHERPGSSETLSADDLVVEPSVPTAAKSGRASSLRTEEFDLLLFVLADPGRVASAGRIDAGVPGAGIRRCAHRGRHVRRLREKIEDEPPMPELLITVWGVGYRFDAPGVCGGKVISRPVRTGRAVLECWFAGVVKARSSALR